MLTIGQLASYTGVTTRTVRHYHQIGLLPEPERDLSGYRRYGSDDVVRLVRIRGLTEAGVPLSRVAELLEAEPQAYAAALQQVDTALAQRIAELRAHRQRLATMTEPDAGILGPSARQILEMMAEMGLDEEFLRIEREAAILVHALYPARAEEWMRWQIQALADPEVRAVYRLAAEATSWSLDDPRVEELARHSVAVTMKHYPPDAESTHNWWSELDRATYHLIDQHGTQSHPIWQRITARVHELMIEAGYDIPG